MTQQAFDSLTFKFTPRSEYQDDKFCAKAHGLIYGDGKSKHDAAKALKVTPAVASLAAQAHEHGRITFKDEKELAKAVVKARGEGQPWSVIGARAGGLSEGRVQQLFEQGSGDSYTVSRLARSARQRTEPRATERPSGKKAAKPATKKRSRKATAKAGK